MSDQKLAINQTMVSGKINFTGMFKNSHQTRLMIPAKDSFSMPSAVMINSVNRLGNVGDMLENIHCSLAGIPKSFKNNDGEIIENANMWLVQV